MDHSLQGKFLLDAVELGWVWITIMRRTSISVSLVMDSIPHNQVVTATDYRIADCKCKPSPECFDKQSKDFTALLWIWYIANSRITVEVFTSRGIYSTLELVPDLPSLDVCRFTLTDLVCKRPLHATRWHISCDNAVGNHTDRTV